MEGAFFKSMYTSTHVSITFLLNKIDLASPLNMTSICFGSSSQIISWLICFK